MLTKKASTKASTILIHDVDIELHCRDAPSVEAHQCVSGPYTGRNFGGRRMIKKHSTCNNLRINTNKLKLDKKILLNKT